MNLVFSVRFNLISGLPPRGSIAPRGAGQGHGRGYPEDPPNRLNPAQRELRILEVPECDLDTIATAETSPKRIVDRLGRRASRGNDHLRPLSMINGFPRPPASSSLPGFRSQAIFKPRSRGSDKSRTMVRKVRSCAPFHDRN